MKLLMELRDYRYLAVLQNNGYSHFAEQAVKLLISYMGIFYVHIQRYWRLPIRRYFALLSGTIICSSVYGDRFFCLPKNISLNATDMTDFLKIKETMSSLQIAEITGKQHAHVMRDIRTLLEQGVTESNFGLSNYKDSTGRNLPCYNLTKKGCLILASGYDAKLREKIIDRWEELETEKRSGGFQVPQSYSEALMLAAKQQGLIEEQQKQIEQKQETIELQEAEIRQAA